MSVKERLAYEVQGYGPEGEAVAMPSLGGISGSPVWGVYSPKEGEVWSTENHVRMTGIEQSYIENTCIKATRWEWVEVVLNKRSSE